MLALLCTAPQLSADDALPDAHSASSASSSSDPRHPDASSGSGSGSATDLPTSSPSPSPRKLRRPRMATLASVSATFSNVTGSLLRRDSLGRSRVASESVPSGKAGRPRVQIGTPSAFKHHFHLGSDSRTSSGAWDEERWRQVIEMRMSEIEGENIPVIEVTTSSTPNTPMRPQPLPRRSTSSDRLAIDAAMAALLANSHENSDETGKEKCKAGEARNHENDKVPDGVVDPAKAAKTAKRASLVKRKPVPPLYPEEVFPLPAPYAAPTLVPPRVGPPPAGDSVDCAVPPSASSSAAAAQAPAISAPVSAPAPVLAPLHISVPRSMSPPVVPPRRHTPVNALTRVIPSSSSSSATLTNDASLVSSADLDPRPGSDPASVSALAPPPACVPAVNGDADADAAGEAGASPRPSISSLMTAESSASAASAVSAASETSAESAAPRTPTEDREGAFGPRGEEGKAGRTRRMEGGKDAETESVYETADDGDGEGHPGVEVGVRAGLRRLRSRRARVDFRAVEVGAEARRDERVS